MCGREENLYKILLEGSILEVCENCSSFGEIIDMPKRPIFDDDIKGEHLEPETKELLVSNFGEKIRKARERKGLTQQQLALNLAEKESIIHRLEGGHFKPSDKLVKKLEQFLQIKLIGGLDEVKEEKKNLNKAEIDFRNRHLTIGDLLNAKDNGQETDRDSSF